MLGACEKSGTTETVVEELENIASVMAELPQVEATLESPRVPWESKDRMLNSAFADKVSTELLNFLKVVTRRGRFDCLGAIAVSAREQFTELRGRVRVEVRTADALDAETLSLVADRLRVALGREVDLAVSVDDSLIGGLVVRVGDTVYDASVANRLGRLREELKLKSTQKIRQNLEQFALAE